MKVAPAEPFTRHGPALPRFPVILSVPHAGRDYPSALISASRLTVERLALLEDRYADLLAAPAFASGFNGLVATRPRAWIDLNRHEREVDVDMITPPPRRAVIRSQRVIGGLGLIPRRLRGHGDILRGPVAAADLEDRIKNVHRPYHRALTEMIMVTRARFGIAIVLDLHSMPPIAGDDSPPRIVLGDRFGKSAASRFTTLLHDVAHRAGLRTADNIPYSGGHILEKHGTPLRDIHAIQVEVDRSLYLDPTLDKPVKGLGGIDILIRAMAIELAREALGTMSFAAIAAE